MQKEKRKVLGSKVGSKQGKSQKEKWQSERNAAGEGRVESKKGKRRKEKG